jgi:hypothetical protein
MIKTLEEQLPQGQPLQALATKQLKEKNRSKGRFFIMADSLLFLLMGCNIKYALKGKTINCVVCR